MIPVLIGAGLAAGVAVVAAGLFGVVFVITRHFAEKEDTHPMGEHPSWWDKNSPQTLIRQDLEPEPLGGFPRRPFEPIEDEDEEDDGTRLGNFTCFFCGREYDTDAPMDYWCYGCEQHLCLACTRPDDPCGEHTPVDHPAWKHHSGAF